MLTLWLTLFAAAFGLTSNSYADYYYHHSESSYSVAVSSSSSTTNVTPSTSVPLTATVSVTTWDVLMDEYGNTQDLNHNTTSPSIGTDVVFSIDSGDGSLSAYSVSTDASGQAFSSLTMGSSNTTVRATSGGSYGTLDITAQAPETFAFSHYESTLSLTLSAPEGSTNLNVNDVRSVVANVNATTWEVWNGNLGGSEQRNVASGPATGALVVFSVVAGNGSLNMGGTYTDGSGNATMYHTQGTTDGTVQVDVSFNSAVASGTIIYTLTSTETFVYNRTEYGTTVILVPTSGTTTDVEPTHTRTFRVEALYVTYEIWVSNLGNSQTHTVFTSTPSGAPVTFSVTNGNGTISAADTTVDNSGYAYATLTMGTQDTTVQAYVSSYGFSAYPTLTYTVGAPTYVYDHSESSLSAGISAPGGTSLQPGEGVNVLLNVQVTTWEVWINALGGTEARNHVTGPAAGAAYTGTVVDSASTIQGYYTLGSIDSNGQSSPGIFGYSVGVFTVNIDITYNGASTGASISYSVSTLPPPEEVYSFSHTASSSTLSINTYDSTSLTTGTTVTFYVDGTTTTYDVYTSNYSNSYTSNYNTYYTPQGLSVSASNGGNVGNTYGTTYSFSMGTSDSQVTASTADGAVATLDFTFVPDP